MFCTMNFGLTSIDNSIPTLIKDVLQRLISLPLNEVLYLEVFLQKIKLGRLEKIFNYM